MTKIRRLAGAAALAGLVAASPAWAGSDADAQALFKQALGLNQAAMAAPDPADRVRLLREVDGLLARIVTEHADTKIGAILAEGKPVGRFSRADVQARLKEAEAAAPAATETAATPAEPEPQVAAPAEADPAEPAETEAEAAAPTAPAETAQAEAAPADPATATATAAEPEPEQVPEWPKPLAEALAAALDPARPLDALALQGLEDTDGAVLVGAAPQVERDGDDELAVKLTDLAFELDDGDYGVLPYLTLTLERTDASHVAFDVDVADTMDFSDAVLTMDKPKVKGVYNTELQTAGAVDVAFTGIAVAPKKDVLPEGEAAGSMTIKSITLTQDIKDGPLLDGSGTFALTDLVVDDGEGARVAIGGITSDFSMSKLDKQGYKGLVEFISLAEQPGRPVVSADQLLVMLATLKWAGLDTSVSINDVSIAKDGEEFGKAGTISAAFGASNDGGKGAMALSVKAGGIALTEAGRADMVAENPDAAAVPAELMPQDLSFTLTLQNLPYADLFKAGVGAQNEGQALAAMGAVVQQHNAHLVISDLALKAPQASLTGGMTVTPVLGLVAPPKADGALTVVGLDRILGAIKKVPEPSQELKQLMAVLLVLNGMGEQPAEGEGKIYRIAYVPGGSPTINDIPLENLMQ